MISGTSSSPGWPHAQVLRNHSVGSTCSRAASGPGLATVTTAHRSVGDALAQSTVTTQYRSSSNTPVSVSSYSGSSRPRAAFTARSCAYGNSSCG